MNDDSKSHDKVIRFPGLAGRPATGKPQPKAKGEASGVHRTVKEPSGAHPAPPASDASPIPGAAGTDGLSDDQRKAISLILSGVSFVFVGLKPTDRGADFFTAIHGDSTDLRNSQPHLAAVIDRAFGRKGI